jgi:L-lysine 2,3-aminomutase
MTKLGKLALVLFCAITSGLAQSPQTAPTPSIVYAVHDPRSINDYKPHPRVVHEMVNRLVLAATGQCDVA